MIGEENILGYFEAATFSSAIALFFTDKRIIGAKTVGISALLHPMGAYHYAKEGGRKAAQTSKLNPEKILKSDDKNFFIPYSDISKIFIRKPGVFRAGKITIDTSSGTKKFTIPNLGLINAHDYDFEFVEKISDFFSGSISVED